jgi:hypothetical protein
MFPVIFAEYNLHGALLPGGKLASGSSAVKLQEAIE